ncbi:PREDICTED: uncharacterized protein LOC104752507 isoform X2 [Camelina sativa]|uniref:Uncharacterized protein LOC104752507 isoform X2 n=1 Tax=Camelina sativa TaxID=90675 RepID=A0ABM0WLW4_CAMSA|nr:PREDICTED: uncharacterized protein LOC104752507 isoform X2 [Camelina sativa]
MPSVTSIFSDAETSIFWDLDACPIPVNLSPALISDFFKESLAYMGYTCNRMSIVAYSSTKLENAQEFESANIKLLQKADKRAKHSEILGDVYLWGISHRGEPANLIVISLIAQHYIRYATFKELGFNVLLAFPDDTIGCPWPLGIPSAVWLWSSFSSGGNPLDINEIKIPQDGTTSLLRDCAREKNPWEKKKKKKKKKKKNGKALNNEIGIPQVGTSVRRACTTKQKQRGKKGESL